ncbi:hypothetical protein ACO0LM_23760 [Undibacterium sp. Di26W]|uniref:hypothetical protein n=1 Tax=Undibacterium sp. Di26W TaxID=3413035 RepID=UPI003BF0E53C
MNDVIYDKSDKGREEIVTRKYRLISKLRPLLVLIDGKKTVAEIKKEISGLGLTEKNIHELIEQEFIHEIVTQEKVLQPTLMTDIQVEIKTEPITVTKAVKPNTSEIEQHQALYTFYNETIKSLMGIRGYWLQLKVERASTIDDFRSIRQAYLEAVLKVKDRDAARSLRDQLDELLNVE